MWNLLLFAGLGLIIGAAARSLYPGRRFTQIVGTMLTGMIGAVIGGMISWSWWPDVDGEFATGNLLLSALASVSAIVIGAGVAYARNISGHRDTSS